MKGHKVWAVVIGTLSIAGVGILIGELSPRCFPKVLLTKSSSTAFMVVLGIRGEISKTLVGWPRKIFLVGEGLQVAIDLLIL